MQVISDSETGRTFTICDDCAKANSTIWITDLRRYAFAPPKCALCGDKNITRASFGQAYFNVTRMNMTRETYDLGNYWYEPDTYRRVVPGLRSIDVEAELIDHPGALWVLVRELGNRRVLRFDRVESGEVYLMRITYGAHGTKMEFAG